MPPRTHGWPSKAVATAACQCTEYLAPVSHYRAIHAVSLAPPAQVNRHRHACVLGAVYAQDNDVHDGDRLKALRILEGAVDDPHLGNPLKRMHRLGTGWFGVILEYEGVLVENAHDEHVQAWLELCKREGKSAPPRWQLNRLEGMKNEQVRFLCIHALAYLVAVWAGSAAACCCGSGDIGGLVPGSKPFSCQKTSR